MSDEVKMEFDMMEEPEEKKKKKPEFPKIAEIVNCKFLNLRTGPGKEYPVGVISQVGIKVEVESVDGEWAKVYTEMGFTGYAMKRFLAL